MSTNVRNPENIDLEKYPPPEGYVVASEEDAKSCDIPGRHGWLFFSDNCWLPCIERNQWPVIGHWTYLRPMTAEERDTK